MGEYDDYGRGWMARAEEVAELRRVLRDLAISADTAELLLREKYPGKAASLYARVKAARELLGE